MLNAIAAAVVGGTSLFGGRGSIWSALLGAAGHRVDQQRRAAARPVDRGAVLRDRHRAHRRRRGRRRAQPWVAPSGAQVQDVAPGWVPDRASLPDTRIVRFAHVARRARAVPTCADVTDYAELQAWSAGPPGEFWGCRRRLLRRRAGPTAPRVALAERRMPGAVWFPGGTPELRAAPAARRRGRARGGRARHRGTANGRRSPSAGCAPRLPPWPDGCASSGSGRVTGSSRYLPELRRGRRRVRGDGAHRCGLGPGRARLRRPPPRPTGWRSWRRRS